MFGRSFYGSVIQRVLSLVIAVMLGTFPVLNTVAIAQAETAPAPIGAPASVAAPASGSATAGADPTAAPAADAPTSWVASGAEGLPSGSKVDLSQCTTSSTVFDLPDGSHVSMISENPVRLRDGGAWKELNPTLVPDAAFGEFSPASTLATVTYSSGDGSTDPVTIAGAEATVGIAVIGSSQDEKLVLGDKVVYTNIATDTAVEYQTLANGFKETVLLASPAASNQVRFSMSLGGLTPRRDASGAWGLYRGNASTPEFDLGELLVTDSSMDAKGDPAICPLPVMEINWIGDDACITCRISREWMDDPARIYPIKVDPSLTLGSGNRSDTYLRSTTAGRDDSHASTTELLAGYYDSTTGHNRSLVRFDVSDIPATAVVTYAALDVIQYWQYWEFKGTKTHLGRLLKTYNNDATWLGYGCQSGHPTVIAEPLETITVAGRDEVVVFDSAETAGAVQDWVSKRLPNNGFMIYQLENADENTDCWRRFRSSNYSVTAERPELYVSWSNPSVNVAPPVAKVFSSGESMITTVTLGTAATGFARTVELAPNRKSNDASLYRGRFAWSSEPLSPDEGWVCRQLATDSYIGYNIKPTEGGIGASGTPRMELDFANSSAKVTAAASVVVRFATKAGSGFGNIGISSLDAKATFYQLGSWGEQQKYWDSGWTSCATTIGVRPSAAVGVAAETTASASWFQEDDTNGDGYADVPNDGNTSGRGSVNLRWQPSIDATAYAVYMWDGARYQKVGTTSDTSWSTSGKGLYPKDSAISGPLPAGAPIDLTVGTGLDLRDDPTKLYAYTSQVTSLTIPAYCFKVTPTSAVGQQPVSDATTITVPLDNRTLHLSDEPAHTSVSLGDLFGNAASAQLDAGALTLDVTDLALPGIGLTTSLSRHYSSLLTTSSTFAPGWRFDFERSIKASAMAAVYTDAAGNSHRFLMSGGAWVSPTGSTEALTGSGSTGWTLTRRDRSKDTFDASGALTSVVDKNGNTISYRWGTAAGLPTLDIVGPGDTVTAPRRITVTFASVGGRAAQAVLRSGAVSQTVTYAVTAPTASVSYFAGTNAASTRTYVYDSASRITDVRVPGFAPSSVGWADWYVSYRLAGITVSNLTGGGTPLASTRIDWDIASRCATVTSSGVPRTVAWNASGTMASSRRVGDSGRWVYVYDAAGNLVRSSSPMKRLTSALYNRCSDLVCSTDEGGATTAYEYDVFDQLIRSIDPSGTVTTNTYDTKGNLRSVLVPMTRSVNASTTFDYNPDGTLLLSSAAISATSSAVTRYGTYDPCGSPVSVSQEGVKLSSNDPSATVTTRATYDALGNVTSTTDASGNVTLRSYDAAGRSLTATDPLGTVTAVTYGPLGNVSGSKTTNPTTSTAIGWSASTVNGLGAPVSLSAKDSSGNVVGSTTYTYDDYGRETRVASTLVPGSKLTTYDDQGRVAAFWAPGAPSDVSSASTRFYYNAEDEVTRTIAPGAVSAASDEVLNADGTVASETDPDGSTGTFTYDAQGNVASITQPTDAGVASMFVERNLAGMVTTITLPTGVARVMTFDRLGRLVSTKQGKQTASTTAYNTLGWLLSSTQSDGTTESIKYDSCGRVLTRTVAGQTTTFGYDSFGRRTSATNPDGTTESLTYDCFGRVVASEQKSSSGALTHQIRSEYDSAGRVSSLCDAIIGASSRFSYSSTGTVTQVASRRFGAAVTTTTVDGIGMIQNRVTTSGGSRLDWSLVATDSAGRMIDATSAALPGADFRIAYDEAGHEVAASPIVLQTTSPSASLAITVQGGYAASLAVPPIVALPTYVYDKTTGEKTGDNFQFRFDGIQEQNAYHYDKASRVASATVAGVTSTYGYDAESGALSSVQRGSEATVTLGYDAQGRLTTEGARTFTNDALGRRTKESGGAGPSVTYTWRASRLLGYGRPSVAATYTYDTDGQRQRSVVTSGSVVTTVTWDYAGLALQGLAAAASNGATYSIDYAYDSDGKPYAGIYRASDATGPVLFQMLSTDRGDVREMLDSSGASFGLYSYDAYGRPVSTLSTGTALVAPGTAAAIMARQPMRYAGYAWDTESGLYYCSQRYYDPASFQFISSDPVRADGEESAYQYCGGNPVEQSDPSGLSAIWSEGGNTSMDAYINAYRYSRNPKTREYFLTRAHEAADAEHEAQVRRDLARARARMGAFAERIAAGLSASRRMSQQSDHSSTAWPIGARYDFTESSSVGVGGGDFNPFTVSVGQFSQSRIQLMGSSGSAPFQFVIRKNVNAETGESADQFSFSVTAPWFGGGKLSSVATFGAGSVSFGYRGTSKPDAYGNASGWSWDAGGNGISSRLRTQTFMQNKSGIVAGAFADYEVNTLKAQAEWAAGAVVAGGALVIIANPETAPFIAGPIGAAATAR